MPNKENPIPIDNTALDGFLESPRVVNRGH